MYLINYHSVCINNTKVYFYIKIEFISVGIIIQKKTFMVFKLKILKYIYNFSTKNIELTKIILIFAVLN